MMDPKIVFQGIESPNVKQQINDLMEDLMQVLPSDSAIRATFGFLHDNFFSEIKIASESVIMSAKDQAGAVGDMLDHVKSNLLGQVAKWRDNRFLAEESH